MSFSRSDLKGDFLGFTFDGIHSSELGIVRVSDGSRYNENLLPTIQDKTIQRPGADGMYYYGSFYTQRQFNIPIAFDSLTEIQLRNLRLIFSDKKVHSLIFDELPYKVYKVKITGAPNLKYVAFDRPLEDYERELMAGPGYEHEDLYSLNIKASPGRIYKGEGQLNFISYSPFARSRFKYLDEYTGEKIPEWYAYSTEGGAIYFNNKRDWADSSRLVDHDFQATVQGTIYTIDEVSSSGVLCYNAGDIDTSFKLNLFFSSGLKGGLTITRLPLSRKEVDEDGFSIFGNYQDAPSLAINPFILHDKDSGICINTKLHLIEGIDENSKPTGIIYNQYIEAGDFFNLETSRVSSDFALIKFSWAATGTTTGSAPSDLKGKINYDYLYY